MIDPSQFYQKIETRGWHSGSLFIRIFYAIQATDISKLVDSSWNWSVTKYETISISVDVLIISPLQLTQHNQYH